ncbi:carbohydrate porin [Luteimonas sp. MC1782]|uniref:DcaP family trimeric outer membrane transporter n=1 Tax=Luteimonas sp. MC1782 TaxID=2760305 RepID=UPI0016035C73|nr:DcaP family trimeric outer membrane transporter [Luteimonas sp. MC1782]MBB1473391.1 carbohydrate porin [Luteimonas sp. MC1782]
MTTKRRNSRRLLATAILVALAAPGTAFAQTAKEVELEARVAQLEAQIQTLLQGQQRQQESIAQAQTRLDEVQVAQPAAKPVQSKPILANPEAVFTYGGFIKFDAMVTDTSDGPIAEGSAGRLFYVPSTIPVTANGAEPDSDPYTDVHAAFSRFWFAADHATDGGDKFRAYIEADMYGGGSANLGNEVNTNTHGITLRQAFVSWNNWLAGQTWSNFQDVAALPEAVDFVGVTEGTTFVRQAQLRYTSGPFSVALENPHTTVSSITNAARNNTGGSDTLPDLTARYVMKGDWGHFSAAGLLRQLKSGDETATGAAVSLSGRFNIGANDDIRWMANYGDGIGRYLGFGLGADSVVDANGNLHAQGGAGGFVAWRHAFNGQLRSNLMYSVAEFDNDRGLAGWGPGSFAATERAQSFHANLIYSPFPKLDIGAEIGWGERELEDDRKGDLKRVQTTVKYTF